MNIRSVFACAAVTGGLAFAALGALGLLGAAQAQPMHGHGHGMGQGQGGMGQGTMGQGGMPPRSAESNAAIEARAGELTLRSPWARATAPGAAVGGGFLQIENAGSQADRLVSASSPISKSVELHSMTMENNVMRMREIEAIDLPAGERVALRPGGLHLMFIGLEAPLQAGQSFPVRLRFERAGEVELQFAVQSMGAMPGMGQTPPSQR